MYFVKSSVPAASLISRCFKQLQFLLKNSISINLSYSSIHGTRKQRFVVASAIVAVICADDFSVGHTGNSLIKYLMVGSMVEDVVLMYFITKSLSFYPEILLEIYSLVFQR
jgi:hypothetical protein